MWIGRVWLGSLIHVFWIVYLSFVSQFMCSLIHHLCRHSIDVVHICLDGKFLYGRFFPMDASKTYWACNWTRSVNVNRAITSQDQQQSNEHEYSVDQFAWMTKRTLCNYTIASRENVLEYICGRPKTTSAGIRKRSYQSNLIGCLFNSNCINGGSKLQHSATCTVLLVRSLWSTGVWCWPSIYEADKATG